MKFTSGPHFGRHRATSSTVRVQSGDAPEPEVNVRDELFTVIDGVDMRQVVSKTLAKLTFCLGKMAQTSRF